MRNMLRISQLMFILFLLAGTVRGFTKNRYISSLCSRADAWTMLPSDHECRKFYVCTGENHHEDNYQEFSCTTNYHFSSEHQRCVYGTCSDKHSTSSTSSCSSSVARQPGDCTRYRLCSRNGGYAVFSCKQGTYFDVERNACLPVAVTPEHQCSCVLPDYSTLINPNNCETYYRCEGGKAVLIQCPEDHYYNSSVDSCLLDTTGVCLEKPTLPPTTDEALALQECDRTGSAMVPHSSDCSRYYVCTQGGVLAMSCPKQRYFNVLRRYCAIDFGMKCTNNTIERNHEISELPQKKEVASLIAPDEDRKLTNFDKLSSKFVSFQR